MDSNASNNAADRIVRRMGPWRYVQFVIVALVAGVLIDWMSPLQTLHAWLAGAAVGVAYFALEKMRGTV